MEKLTGWPDAKSLGDIAAEAALEALNNPKTGKTLEQIADAIGAAIQAYHDEIRRSWG
jgi:hypothetical protein